MRLLSIAFLLSLALSQTASAGVVIFDLFGDGAGTDVLSGSIYLRTVSAEVNGVTFDAQIQVEGSSNILQTQVQGLGVAGSGSNELNNDEALTFTFAGFSNVSGGVPSFDGFTFLELSVFGSADAAILSQDNLIDSGDIVSEDSQILLDQLVQPTPNPPVFGSVPAAEFTLFAPVPRNDPFVLNPASFRANSVSANFSAVAVPEPSSWLFLPAAIGFLRLRRRRLAAQNC